MPIAGRGDVKRDWTLSGVIIGLTFLAMACGEPGPTPTATREAESAPVLTVTPTPALLATPVPSPTPTPTSPPTPTPIPPPTASFSLDVSGESAPVTVRFSDTSQGHITSWRWDFGDLASSTDPMPTHEYTKAGSYTVQLIVSGLGGSDTTTRSDRITVIPGPLAQVVATPDTITTQVQRTALMNARTLDQFRNEISGVAFIWDVPGPAGSIDDVGVFTAGTKAGIYEDAVTIEVIQGTVVQRGTATVIVEPGPLDHVTLEPASATMEVTDKLIVPGLITVDPEQHRLTAIGFDPHGNEIPGLEFAWLPGSIMERIDSQTVQLSGASGDRYEVKAVATYRGQKRTGRSLVGILPVWIPAGLPTVRGAWHTATLLADGKVLIVDSSSNAQIYDPGSNSFSFTNNSLFTHGSGLTATRLPDGRV